MHTHIHVGKIVIHITVFFKKTTPGSHLENLLLWLPVDSRSRFDIFIFFALFVFLRFIILIRVRAVHTSAHGRGFGCPGAGATGASLLMWVLGIKLRFSVRAAYALGH